MFFLWLVLIQIGIFVMLVLFLRMLFTRNLTRATTHLHTLNQDYSQKIEEAKKHQQEAEKYYDEMILKAKTEAEKLKVQISKEAHELQDTTVKETRKQSEEILKQAENARESMLKEVQREIDLGAVRKAAEWFGEVLPEEAARNIHSRWIEALADGGLDSLGRLNLPDDIQALEVATAFPLTAPQKESILRKIRQKTGRELTLSEKACPELLAGCRISLGNVVMDGTLLFKISEKVRDAARD